MIKELTKEQSDKFGEYVKVWTEKGLTTQRQTESDAKIDFWNFQKHILKKENPAPVIILDSPLKCWMAVVMSSAMKSLPAEKIQKNVMDKITPVVGKLSVKHEN